MVTYAGQYGPELIISTGAGVAAVAAAAGASATVKLAGTATMATLYTSRTKSATTSNPTTLDSRGNLTFYADPGRYDVTIGASTTPVDVAPDPYETGLELSVLSYGAKADGTTDDSAAIAAALTAATTSGATVTLPPGATCKITSGLTIDVSTQRLYGRNSIIDASALSSGQAIRLTASASPSYRQKRNAPWLQGVEITGPGKASGTAAGLYLAGVSSSVEVAHGSLEHVVVHDFPIGVKLGSNCHSVDFALDLYQCGKCVDDTAATANAGESLHFIGSSMFNSDLVCNLTNAFGDYTFTACRFDYNSQQFIVTGGVVVTLLGCHIEAADAQYGSNYPVDVSNYGTFNMHGGVITGVATSIPAFIRSTNAYGFAPCSFAGVQIFNNKWGGTLTSFAAGIGIVRVKGAATGALLTSPSVPASGTALRNPFPFDCGVYIAGSGTVTQVQIDGVAMPGARDFAHLPAGASIQLSYIAGAPTWAWVNNGG